MTTKQSLYNKFALAITALVWALTPITPAYAETDHGPNDLKGGYYFRGDLPDGDGNTADVKIDLAVRLGTLMGEPVVYCTGRWNLISVKIGGKTYNSRDVPAGVWRQVDLIGVNFAFPMWVPISNRVTDHPEYADLPCDPGVFYPSGDKHASFNVPGSPAWDRLLLRQNWNGLGYAADWNARTKAASNPESFVSAENAKAWFKGGKRRIQFNGQGTNLQALLPSNLISASINLWPVREWVQAQQQQAQAKRQEQRRQRQAKTGTGQDPLDQMFAEVDAKESEQQAASQTAETRNADNAAKQAMEQRRAALKAMQCGDAPAANETSLDEVAHQAMQSRAKCDVKLVRYADHSLAGYKGQDGNVRIAAKFYSARDFNNGLGLACLDYEHCGFVSVTGEFVIKAEYPSGTLRDFAEGRAAVMVGKKWGFLDKEGRMVVSPRYDKVSDFKEGRATAKEFLRSSGDSCSGWTNYYNEITIGPNGESIGTWHEVTDFSRSFCLHSN